MLSLKTLFNAAAHLFYPHICIGCGSDLLAPTNLLCLQCITNLPHTNFEKIPNNPIEKIFYGRVDVHAATAGFYFTKGTLVQTLIHEFKYKGNKAIGIYLSKLMAEKMKESNRFNNIDYLIPLPLFADKEFKRGYNQAKIICDGINEILQVPVALNKVIRNNFTETQTKKHRTERWENVAESFTILEPNLFKNKHIALVDDVVTTGATLEACAQKIKMVSNAEISIVSLTTASK